MDYAAFLEGKARFAGSVGFEAGELCPDLYDWQAAVTRWAISKGRAALFEDCGLGKTLQQIAWADAVAKHSRKPSLIVCPLAVAEQTIGEGLRFGFTIEHAERSECVLQIINYERLHRLECRIGEYGAVVLDESSILKNFTGATRNALIETFADTPYRLCCTATPAPNDYAELGNHAEFLGVMSRVEMLATFFTHDGGDTSKWRLKGHAKRRFWEWLASWALTIRKPSDIGYSDEGWELPELRLHDHTVPSVVPAGQLFDMKLGGLQERRAARRDSIEARCSRAAELANAAEGPVVVWCGLNRESELLSSLIPGSVEVKGADAPEVKTKRLSAFSSGRARVIVTKPTIAGFGLNWQHCGTEIYVGLSDSFEAFYQSVRRCWRFGRKDPVDVHLVYSEAEGEVIENVRRKERAADEMMTEVMATLSAIEQEELGGMKHQKAIEATGSVSGDGWEIRGGDCVERIKELETDSVGLSVFSPPFANLYTYSASDKDLGNCSGDAEFFEHFGYLIPELLRATMPGRLCAMHVMNLPQSKSMHGEIGIRDFRGEVIRSFVEAGWIYHSEVVIWKDPLVAATRTKALGLLHKQLCKDSAMSRQGIPDYVVVFRKPGENPQPIARERGFERYVGGDPEPKSAKSTDPATNKYGHQVWQRYASPVWMDIQATKTLQSVADENDERHICPLQLQVIERCLELWSLPGDLVLDPFAGIGSTGYEAVKAERRFIGFELKAGYFDVAVKNLKMAEYDRPQLALFPSEATA